jgi:hypothetical protein
MSAITAPHLASLISTLQTGTALGRLNNSEATAAFAQISSLGWSVQEPGSSGNLATTDEDLTILATKLISTTAFSRLALSEAKAVLSAAIATNPIAKPATLPLLNS